MPLSIFSPNSKITGGALFVEFNSKEGDIYIKLIPQIANNADKKNNFDGKNPINMKINEDEAGAIINAETTKSKTSFFHQFDGKPSASGNFNYYNIPSTEQGKPDREGFGLSIKKDNRQIKIGLSIGAAEKLMLYLVNALSRMFDASHAEDIKRNKEYFDKQKSQAPKTEEKEPESELQAPAAEKEEDLF